METWSLRVQVSRWAAVSVTPGQYRHSLDCIFPILESLSLVGKIDCIILKLKVFCSGESPNILDIWYEEESSTPGCLSSSLELSRIVKISFVWVQLSIFRKLLFLELNLPININYKCNCFPCLFKTLLCRKRSCWHGHFIQFIYSF